MQSRWRLERVAWLTQQWPLSAFLALTELEEGLAVGECPGLLLLAHVLGQRIQKLLKDGKFDEETSSVYGLPKVRTKFRVVSGKKAKALEKAREEKLAEQAGGGEG